MFSDNFVVLGTNGQISIYKHSDKNFMLIDVAGMKRFCFFVTEIKL